MAEKDESSAGHWHLRCLEDTDTIFQTESLCRTSTQTEGITLEVTAKEKSCSSQTDLEREHSIPEKQC